MKKFINLLKTAECEEKRVKEEERIQLQKVKFKVRKKGKLAWKKVREPYTPSLISRSFLFQILDSFFQFYWIFELHHKRRKKVDQRVEFYSMNKRFDPFNMKSLISEEFLW